MNIRSIKNRANELLVYSKPQYLRILIIMLVIGLVPSIFSGGKGLIAILSLIISIIFLPFEHGYIVSSLKIVRNNYTALKDEDGWIGFTRFKELFPTYFVMNLIIFAIMFVLILIMTLILIMFYGATLSSLPSAVAYGDTNALMQLLLASPTFVSGILLFVIVIVSVTYILSIYFFAVPYLLEQYHMETTVAIKESIQFMKGHAFDLFRLDISYIGWILLVGLVSGVISNLLGSLPILGSTLAAVVSGLLAIYTYEPQYRLSKAIFFEEIAYQRYGMQTQQENIQEDIIDNVVDDDMQGE